MRFLKVIFILALLISVSSCSRIYGDNSYFANRETIHLKAKTTPPLKIPPGYDSSTIHAEYPIADHQYPESAKKVSLVPPELYPAPK